MSFQETKVYSVWANKCPKCHKGNFFIVKNPYNLKLFDKMNSRCSICNENFERETGFYYGAMYVSYGLTVGFGIVLFLLMCVMFNNEIISYIITFSALLIVLLPVIFRLSRLIWINLFVRYNPQLNNQAPKS